MPNSFHDRWNGPLWRWWALASGVVLTGLAFAFAALLTSIFNQDTAPLAFLFVTLILFVFSMLGSGMLDGLVSRTSTDRALTDKGQDDAPGARSAAKRARRDRRTIRCGLAAVTPFAAFLLLLFR